MAVVVTPNSLLVTASWSSKDFSDSMTPIYEIIVLTTSIGCASAGIDSTTCTSDSGIFLSSASSSSNS